MKRCIGLSQSALAQSHAHRAVEQMLRDDTPAAMIPVDPSTPQQQAQPAAPADEISAKPPQKSGAEPSTVKGDEIGEPLTAQTPEAVEPPKAQQGKPAVDDEMSVEPPVQHWHGGRSAAASRRS